MSQQQGTFCLGEESVKGQDFNDGLVRFEPSSQNVFKKASNRMLSLNGCFSLEHKPSENRRLK